TASADQIQECFQIFDKDNDGKVSIEELGSALRSLGKNPTNAELNTIKGQLNAKEFDLATFKTVYRKPIKTPTEQSKEMLDAFRALDKEGNGTIQEAELRQLLLNLGDALTSSEVEELMKEVSVSGDGAINYESFVDMLVTGYPLASA
uniref:Myosin regulatory light chain n=2 Tax=Physarum polycephalum TaxID=5791 RepID=MLR_PHYPO|nr:RecName: Full=Myosin regulatory light chain; AltName: Full=Calcium-binding light chain [Physarum polycephalum]